LGKEPKDEPDWLGFDKLAKMIGELGEEDSAGEEDPAGAEPPGGQLPEAPPQPELPGEDTGVAPKD